MLNREVDSKQFGLNSRVKLKVDDEGNIYIIKKIKSRIIMKDGEKIVEVSQAIKNKNHNAKVSLIISGPICSKTKSI